MAPRLVMTLALAWLLVSGVAAMGEEKLKVAVLDVKGVGLSQPETMAISEGLRESLAKTNRYVLVDRTQLEAILEEKALQQTVCEGSDCAAKLGALSGAKRIVGGKAIKLGEATWLLSATMVDVDTSETMGLETVRHRGDLLSLLEVRIPELAHRLMGQPIPNAPQATAEAPPARPPGQPLRVAIFPTRLSGIYAGRLKSNHNKLVSALYQSAQQNTGFAIHASFEEGQGNSEAQQHARTHKLHDMVMEKAWEGFFSVAPNELLAFQVGEELGVDLVFMHHSKHDGGRGDRYFEAYLLDVQKLKVVRVRKDYGKGEWGKLLTRTFKEMLSTYQKGG